MPATLPHAQRAASRLDGADLHRRGSPLALLSIEDRGEFAALHTAVTSDWGPRDAYERRWVMELVTSMLRQDHLRDLELATLAAAAAECPPSEATVRKLDTFARYGSRIDKDIGRALQALRVLRKRPDAWIEELRECTSEPGEADATARDFTNELSPRTSEPSPEAVAPPPVEPAPFPAAEAGCTSEPTPRLNRQQRRALAAKLRRRAA
ncbi:MAG: hypothetical protein AB7I59_10615 [Geminicoccaceae bacterium]